MGIVVKLVKDFSFLLLCLKKSQHLKCEILIPNKLKEEFSHLHQRWCFQISMPAVPSKAAAAVWFSLNAFALCALASLLSSEVGAHPWSVSTSWFTAWVSVISEAKWSHLLPVVTCWQDQVCVLCDVTSSLGSCFPDGEFWSFHWICVQSSTTSCSRIVQLNKTQNVTPSRVSASISLYLYNDSRGLFYPFLFLQVSYFKGWKGHNRQKSLIFKQIIIIITKTQKNRSPWQTDEMFICRFHLKVTCLFSSYE